MAKHHRFPSPLNINDTNRLAFLNAQAALIVYINETGKEAQKFSPTVRDWFKQRSVKEGWGAVAFPREYKQPSVFAGVLFQKKKPGDDSAPGTSRKKKTAKKTTVIRKRKP